MINKKMLKDNQSILIALFLTIVVVFVFQSHKDKIRKQQVPELPEAPTIDLYELDRSKAVPLG